MLSIFKRWEEFKAESPRNVMAATTKALAAERLRACAQLTNSRDILGLVLWGYLYFSDTS